MFSPVSHPSVSLRWRGSSKLPRRGYGMPRAPRTNDAPQKAAPMQCEGSRSQIQSSLLTWGRRFGLGHGGTGSQIRLRGRASAEPSLLLPAFMVGEISVPRSAPQVVSCRLAAETRSYSEAPGTPAHGRGCSLEDGRELSCAGKCGARGGVVCGVASARTVSFGAVTRRRCRRRSARLTTQPKFSQLASISGSPRPPPTCVGGSCAG